VTIFILFEEFQSIPNFILEDLGRFLIKAFFLDQESHLFFEFEMIATALAYVEVFVQLFDGSMIQLMVKIFVQLADSLFASHLPIPFPIALEINKVNIPSNRFQSPLLRLFRSTFPQVKG
jgi:hypothetical protein